MLYRNRIDISEGFDHLKNNRSEECMICHYWVFNHGFKYQDFVRNVCYDLTVLCLNMSDVVIITVKDVDYNCIIITLANLESLIC